MTRSECVAFLQELEQRFDTGSLLLDGIRVWPLVRMKIGERIVSSELRHSKGAGYTARSRAEQLARLVSGSLDSASWAWRMPRTDLLLHTKLNSRTVLNGRTHDRFIDPLLAAAASEGLASLVMDRSEGEQPTAPMATKARRFDATAAIEAGALLHWRRPVPGPDAVPGLPELLAYAGERVQLDTHQLMDQLHGFLFYLRFHRRVLRLARPRCVFVVCWYSVENMAIAHACHMAGVRCVDLQHGVQGPAHIAYGNWTAIGAEGYSLMPDVFWCWDEGSAAHIARWALHTPHRALALGNGWNEMALTLDPRTPWKADGRKRILFTAQSLQDLLPSVVLDAIRATTAQAQWVVRIHPGMPELAVQVKELLQAAGLKDDVVLDDPRSSPLAAVLKDCALHVTPFSSVILEASMAGVPSAAVHPHSADLYPDQLATGELTMTLNAEELITKVKHAKPAQTQLIALPPIAERLRTVLDIPLAR